MALLLFLGGEKAMPARIFTSPALFRHRPPADHSGGGQLNNCLITWPSRTRVMGRPVLL